MVDLQLDAWGILGMHFNDQLLESILVIAGHNTIRCTNRNGRALANKWLKNGRDGRAQAITGAEQNWTAYTTICEMIAMETHSDVPYVTVQANIGIVYTMLYAAFGQNVLGCSLYQFSNCTQASHLFDRAMVFQGAVILMENVRLIPNGNNPTIEVLRIEPFYELKDTLQNINVIHRSMQARIDGRNTETCIVHNIVKLLDLSYENLCEKNTQFESFNVSLKSLLLPNHMTPVLDEFDATNLQTYGIIDGTIVTAFYHAKRDSGLPIRITEDLHYPRWDNMFYAVLWDGGPRFCVVDDGIHVFRTSRFPTPSFMALS
jgi:hypothetical protein